MNISVKSTADDEVPPVLNADLLPALQKAERAVREDLLRQYYADAALMRKARARLRAEESSVADVDAWLVTFAGRAATVYVLKSLYVRVLEDQGLLAPERIRDAGTYPLFAELFPNLGLDAYLRTVFTDAHRLLPELFASTPVEIAEPSANAARVVWEVWQQRNTNGEAFAFNGEDLDTRFIGDLYQDLDPQVKDRYALLQTPRFVESFILDRILTPALETFGLNGFRMLDPTCGSGHFLLGGFERLARLWRRELGNEHDPRVKWEAALHALASVSGADLNEYASALTRFRLLLGVVRETGVRDTTRLATLHFDVITCDALIPWETLSVQPRLDGSSDPKLIADYGDEHERRETVRFFSRTFHAIVGNPPYKEVSDENKRQKYHDLWPRSAKGQYSLSAPMAERFLLLSCRGGYTGFIVSNNFSKREFGIGLITSVLPSIQLDMVIDTSGVYLPGHGTPTVIVVARNNRADSGLAVQVIAGKRGEPGVPDDPAKGNVWLSILESLSVPDFENKWIARLELPQSAFRIHPWIIASKPTLALKAKFDEFPSLDTFYATGGAAVRISHDEIFIRRWITPALRRSLIEGDAVRDWSIKYSATVLCPYDGAMTLIAESAVSELWPFRTTLSSRKLFGNKTYRAGNAPWWKYHQITNGRLGAGINRIIIAEISSDAHFLHDDSDAIFTQTAPLIVFRNLKPEAYKDVTSVLNSSSLELWYKMVCFPKGGDKVGEGRVPGEGWEDRYVRNSTNVVKAPYDPDGFGIRQPIVRAIELAVEGRQLNDPRRIIATRSPGTIISALSSAKVVDERDLARLVFLQEELDWLMYERFGLVTNIPKLDVTAPRILKRGHRPFEIVLARRVNREGEQTKWFERHHLTPVAEIPSDYDDELRNVLQARIALIETELALEILEQPKHKRRWSLIPWEVRVREAASEALASILEDILRAAGPTRPPTLAEIFSALEADEKAIVVLSLLVPDESKYQELVRRALDSEAIPDSPSRLFKPAGLDKLVAHAVAGTPEGTEPFAAGSATDWKRVWRLQEREDAGERIDPMPAAPPFKPPDYAHPNGWNLRGKFNVPNERFIVYDDVAPKRYGWGGWTASERALASLQIFQLRKYENDGASDRPLDDPSRCPIQFALWDKLDELRRLADPIEPSVRSIAEICEAHCPCPVLERWRAVSVGKKVKPKGAGRIKSSSKGAEPVESGEATTETPVDSALVLAVHARIRSAGERGRSNADLLAAAAGDKALLRRVVTALRARGEIDVIGKGRGTRYVDPREVERLAGAELPLYDEPDPD